VYAVWVAIVFTLILVCTCICVIRASRRRLLTRPDESKPTPAPPLPPPVLPHQPASLSAGLETGSGDGRSAENGSATAKGESTHAQG
jgi:hypothetical protein